MHKEKDWQLRHGIILVRLCSGSIVVSRSCQVVLSCSLLFLYVMVLHVKITIKLDITAKLAKAV